MTKAHNTDPERAGQPEEEVEQPTVRDNRRIDPQTYQPRDAGVVGDDTSATGTGSGGGVAPDDADVSATETSASPDPELADSVADTPVSPDDELGQLRQEIADRTADLQRVQAEYVNYKRRTDRDRDQARNTGAESVIRDLLPVLDSVRYAREHEELTGGFKGVADELDQLANKHGVEVFGAQGDPFDPHLHEALMHAQATEPITGPTCVTIMQPGYKVGERVLRPARVAVAEPQEESTSSESEPAAVSGSSDAIADPGEGATSTGQESAGETGAEQHDRETAG